MDYKNEIDHLDKQLEFYNELILALSKLGFKELTSVIGPLLKLNHDSGKSIKLLAENNLLRDLIILSRPFIEGIINIGFICCKGDEGIIKSKKHAFQKGYRDLFKNLEIEGFNVKVGLTKEHKDFIDPYRPQNLIDALEEYTTKKDKEVTTWTKETAKEKVELLGEKYGVLVNGLLRFAFFVVYRDVSEIIHGTYYGALIFIGMQNRDISSFKSSDEAAAYFTDHQFKLSTLVLQQVSTSIVALIQIISQEFNDVITIQEITEKSYDAMIEYTANTKLPANN